MKVTDLTADQEWGISDGLFIDGSSFLEELYNTQYKGR